MKNVRARAPKNAKRRTTLALPRESLAAAESMARARHVNLSTVIAELLDEGLHAKRSAERSGQVLESYRQAFVRFTDAEMLLLDGIVLDDRVDR